MAPLCGVPQAGRYTTFLHFPEVGYPLVVVLEEVLSLLGRIIREHQATYLGTRGGHLPLSDDATFLTQACDGIPKRATAEVQLNGQVILERACLLVFASRRGLKRFLLECSNIVWREPRLLA